MFETLQSRFQDLLPAVDFCSLRIVDEQAEYFSVRQNVPQPLISRFNRGAMVTVIDRGGYGYAATSDLSTPGLESAIARARRWAAVCARHPVADFSGPRRPCSRGVYENPAAAAGPTRRELLELLRAEAAACRLDSRIVDWEASVWTKHAEQLYLTSEGGRIEQRFDYLVPALCVTAYSGADSQTRSFGGRCFCRQGGLSILPDSGWLGSGRRAAEEALELLGAPNCPTQIMDVLLMPSQMMIQIHESIGHPLELDRILGDERNFAGGSFVTLDMFGRYQYGSDLLNVSFDPYLPGEFAGYRWDDDGSPAEKRWLIRNGRLLHALGGAVSQARTGLEGVAASRACSWNRPPVDRIANLNIEPGTSSMAAMIASVEEGILMDANVSWSIDDSRNKFQFGCEYGRLIKRGVLGKVVKNPNYRGVSSTFWRSLKAVGDAATLQIMGTPYCGKAEPSQQIHVGHASPACLFENIDVFGGES